MTCSGRSSTRRCESARQRILRRLRHSSDASARADRLAHPRRRPRSPARRSARSIGSLRGLHRLGSAVGRMFLGPVQRSEAVSGLAGPIGPLAPPCRMRLKSHGTRTAGVPVGAPTGSSSPVSAVSWADGGNRGRHASSPAGRRHRRCNFVTRSLSVGAVITDRPRAAPIARLTPSGASRRPRGAASTGHLSAPGAGNRHVGADIFRARNWTTATRLSRTSPDRAARSGARDPACS